MWQHHRPCRGLKERWFILYKEYTTIFVTGFTVLIIELLASRIMAPFYGNSIFVWASIIGMTIASLAVGYYLGGRFGGRISVTLVSALIVGSMTLMFISEPVLEFTSDFGIMSGSIMAVTMLFAPTIILFGMYSPMLIHRLGGGAGATAGKVFAVGTAGSFFGALVTGFVLIPSLGIDSILVLSIGLIVGVSIFWIGDGRRRPLPIALIGISFIVLTMSLVQGETNTQVVFEKTSMYGNVKVVELKNDWHALLVDGSLQSFTHESGMTLVPFANYAKVVYMINPEIDDVLILGLGSGGLSFVFDEKSDNVTTVEIDPNVVEMSSQVFGYDGNVVVDDARHYIQSNDQTYDAVVYDIATGDSFPPHLFTQEMFQSVEDKLNDDGVVTVHFDGRLDGMKLTSLYKTLDSVFDNVFIISLGDGILDAKIYYATNASIDKSAMIANIDRAYNSAEQPVYSNQIMNRIESLDGGIVMTDNYNPIDIWQIEATQAWRDYTWENFQEYL